MMKDLKQGILIGILVILLVEQTLSSFCTESQNLCSAAGKQSETCRNAEQACSNWANDIQQSSGEIPNHLRRQSPWNASCSYEEVYCPLTFQCINKTESCTFYTQYQGIVSSSTPFGEPCSGGGTYCPLLASCIPANETCSLAQLGMYLQSPGYGYFGQNCSFDQVFCPGTQSCILNTTDCSYNSSLNAFKSNITCPESESFCTDERKCTNGSCITPSYPAFNVYDNGTGWKQFCDNYKFICPKIVAEAVKCKEVYNASSACKIPCDRTPMMNCECPDGQYKCSLKAKCMNNTMPCAEPASSVCSSELSTSALFSSNSTSVDSSSLLPLLDSSISESLDPTMTASMDPSISSSIYPSITPSPICNYTCGTGRFYCSSLNACVLIGYNHCYGTGKYCAEGYTYCNGIGSCTKTSICPIVSTTEQYNLQMSSTPQMSLSASLLQTIVPLSLSSSPASPLSPPPSPLAVSSSPPTASPAVMLSLYSSPHSPYSSAMPSSPHASSAHPPSPSAMPSSPHSSFAHPPSPSTVPSSPHASSAHPPSPSTVPSSPHASSAHPPSPSAMPSSPHSSSAHPPSPSTVPSSPHASSAHPRSSSAVPSLPHASSAHPPSPSTVPSSPHASSAPPRSPSTVPSSPHASSAHPRSSSAVPSSPHASFAHPRSSSAVPSSPHASFAHPRSSSAVPSSPHASFAHPSSPSAVLSSPHSSFAHPSSSSAVPFSPHASSVHPSSYSAMPHMNLNSSASLRLHPSSKYQSDIKKSSPVDKPTPSQVHSRTVALYSSVAPHTTGKPTPTQLPPDCLYFLLQLRDRILPLNKIKPTLPLSKKIAVSGLQGSANKLIWKAYHGNSWKVIPYNVSQKAAYVLGQEDTLKLEALKPSDNFHGLVYVNISLVSSSETVGKYINANDVQQCFLALFFIPELISPQFNLQSTAWKINEDDSNCNGKIKLDKLIKTPIPTPKFYPLVYNPNNTYMKEYKEEVEKYKSVPLLISKDFSKGVMKRIVSGVQTQLKSSSSPSYLSPDEELCFIPDANFYGTVFVTLRSCYKTPMSLEIKCHKDPLKINLTVENVDDQFKCKSGIYVFPTMEPNTWPNPNGIMVGNITSNKTFIDDIDGGPTVSLPGLAIVRAVNSSYGQFEYRLENEKTWKALLVTSNSVPYGRPSGSNLTLFLLGPKDWIRFQAASNVSGWTELEARQSTTLYGYSWNSLDKRSHGVNQITMGSYVEKRCAHFPKTICCNLLSLGIRRKFKIGGCDMKPGSVAVNDSCGVCGGDNSTCTKCDGVLNSNASLDACGQCTGGATGKVYNYLVDCAGECNKSVVASCGSCQLRSAKKVNFTDCAGVCDGNATINKCRYCVGGSTKRPMNYGLDGCGICGGDNSTCRDCSGTVRGTKLIDLCGKCLSPTDQNFDTDCTVLGTVNPFILVNSTVAEVSIRAAGVNSYSTVVCNFVKGSTRVPAPSSNLKTTNGKKTGIVLATPSAVIPGTYEVECQFDGSLTKKAKNSIIFYSKADIKVNLASPAISMYTAAVDVTITGSGFFNSSELACYTKRKGKLNAVFVSSTAVKCSVPALPRSISLSLSLSFSKSDGKFDLKNYVKHDKYINVATITKCMFHDNLNSIIIQLNKDSVSIRKTKSCSEFIANTTKLGENPTCLFIGKTTFRITLGRKNTISPGDTLQFLNKNIKDRLGEVTKYNIQNETCLVKIPVGDVKPEVQLKAPSKIGVCAKTRLAAVRLAKFGRREIKISWRAMVDPSYITPLSAVQVAALSHMNMILSSSFANNKRPRLEANASLINVKIRYSVTVENFLGLSSVSNQTITRTNKQVPTLDVGETRRTVKISEDFTLKVRTIFEAKCLQSGTSVIVKWSVDDSSITLKRNDKKKILISKGTLKAGKTYTFEVLVTMANDQLSSASSTVEVKTTASELVAINRIPSDIGYEEDITLDGSQSNDPDASTETEKYRWDLFSITNNPLYVKQNGVSKRVIFYGKKVKIPVKNYLLAGNSYIVRLTYSKGTRTAPTKSQTVKVVSNIPPQIFLKPPSDAKINPTKRLLLRAAICGVGKFTFNWECKDCGDFSLQTKGVVLNSISGEKNLERKGCFRADLGIKANQLLGGASYDFVLTCNSTTSTASSTVAIVTNNPPLAGKLIVSPATGNATTTKFELDASSDFSDDVNDYPLSYTFCYGKNAETCFPSQPESILENQVFPPGDASNGNLLTVSVFVADIYGATVRVDFNITVAPPPPKSDLESEEEASQFESEILQDPLAVCAQITVSIKTSDTVDTGTLSPKKAAARQKIATAVMGQASSGGVPTKEGKKLLTLTIVVIFTTSGTQMDKGTKLQMTNTMLILIGITTVSSKRRRRSSSSPVIDPLDVTQVENNLIPYKSLEANSFDPTSQTSKQNFITYVDALMAGMCGNMIINEPAAIARSTVVVIQSYYKDFSGNDSFISLGNCSDCKNFISGPSSLALGSSLLTSYSSYICDISKGTSCSGACIVSAQMPGDFLSSSLNSSRISDVLRIKILNPETADHAELAASNLPNPMTVKIPVTRKTNGSYQCHVWDQTSGSWVQSGIYTHSQTLMTSGNLSYVSCIVNKTAYIAIFEGPAIPATTLPPTTTVAATTAVYNYTNKPSMKARFEFAVNCTTYLNASTKASFMASVKKACAKKLGVPESALQQFNASCGSIVIIFNLVGHLPNSTVASVNASLMTLQNLIKSGALTITLSDGRNITADSSSFAIVVPSSTAGPTTIKPTTLSSSTTTNIVPPSKPADKGLSGGAIAGIVIGVLVAVAVIAVLAYMFIFKKKTKLDPTVEPNSNILEMDQKPGNQNEGYHDSV